MKVRDANGNLYQTLTTALKANGLIKYQCGSVYYRFRKNGKAVVGGMEFTAIPDEIGEYPAVPKSAHSNLVQKEDPIIKALRQRYSDEELKQIAKGEGIENKQIAYPEIRLTGKHHKILVMSDTHIGSRYSPPEWHNIVSAFANNSDIDCILHCGDLVDGLKIERAGTQMYELTEIGYEAQKKKAIELLSLYEKPIYLISGNHDAYYKNFAGANIVKAVADALPNVEYIGHDSADIDIDGCTIRLHHGTDGNSYALSYRLQKCIEAMPGGQKPNIFLAGHVHKFCYLFERNVHAVSVPCMQMQTDFMRGKRLAAHTGFCVIEFDTNDGKVSNFSVHLFPFYA